MSDRATYDRIGRGYVRHRRVEPTWAAAIEDALGPSRTVVNVGAGTGSYEPLNRDVTAVEPSVVMIGQRPVTAAPVVRAVAESLPFRDNTFDAAMAVLTIHHWSEVEVGLAELRRVAPLRIVMTWDPTFTNEFWLARDYLPQVQEGEHDLATLEQAVQGLGSMTRTVPLSVPANCADGVFAAYWRRPEMYLRADVRAAMSATALLPQPIVDDAVRRLANDLEDGTWDRKYGYLKELATLDLGYRLVVCDES